MPDDEVEVVLDLATHQRGWLEPGRLRLSTLRPLGLARSWSWLRPDTRLLMYPTLDAECAAAAGSAAATAIRRAPARTANSRTIFASTARATCQRQIAWKASARADRLLVREYESAVARDITLDWQALGELGREEKIRRLARWVVEAERSGSRYALFLPGERMPAGRGAEHRHACLRALALLPACLSPWPGRRAAGACLPRAPADCPC